ncbi:MAG: XRE family transcriptional regulator, partial [Reyranella sp.]
IRERAVGLCELSRLIGWDASRYQYYEDSYKKPYMPVELIDLIRPHLVGRGDPPITHAELDGLLPPQRKPAIAPPPTRSGHVDDAARLGAYIRATREARGIDVEILAKIVGLKAALLSKVESDDHRPTDDVLRKIARTLGLEGEDLVARARRDAEWFALIRNPNSRPVVEALLRTTRDLPPEKVAERLEQIAEEVAKSKP